MERKVGPCTRAVGVLQRALHGKSAEERVRENGGAWGRELILVEHLLSARNSAGHRTHMCKHANARARTRNPI